MRKLKKAIIGVLASAMLMGAMTGCGKAASDDITVISREDGSGTRGAFIELFGIEEKDADGNNLYCRYHKLNIRYDDECSR